jgi:penicillin-binding protein activator
MKNIVLFFVLSVIIFAGCAKKTTYIDTANDEGKVVMGIDYRDFDMASSQMLQSLFASGVLNKKDGSRYVVTTGRVVNDTMQRIDTDQLMAKIEEELLNSGQVVMTSAVGGNGPSDDMVYKVREIRDSKVSEEFKDETLAAKKQLIAPELSMSGKIIQRNIKYDKGNQQVEYYFQLQLTDLTSGLRFWQKESLIGKRGSNKSVAW